MKQYFKSPKFWIFFALIVAVVSVGIWKRKELTAYAKKMLPGKKDDTSEAPNTADAPLNIDRTNANTGIFGGAMSDGKASGAEVLELEQMSAAGG